MERINNELRDEPSSIEDFLSYLKGAASNSLAAQQCLSRFAFYFLRMPNQVCSPDQQQATTQKVVQQKA